MGHDPRLGPPRGYGGSQERAAKVAGLNRDWHDAGPREHRLGLLFPRGLTTRGGALRQSWCAPKSDQAGSKP